MSPSTIIYGVIALAVCAVLYYARKGGQDGLGRKVAENDLKAADRIADAKATGPTDLDAVRERVRNGGKL